MPKKTTTRMPICQAEAWLELQRTLILLALFSNDREGGFGVC